MVAADVAHHVGEHLQRAAQVVGGIGAVDGVGGAGQRGGAQRHHVGALTAVRQASGVAIEHRSTHMAPELLSSTLGALQRDLPMFSPYFVPGEHGVIMLTDLEERGVQVRVLTNSRASTDVGAVHAGYAEYRKPLLRGGVEIFEFKPEAVTAQRGLFDNLRGSSGANLHAKTSILDREALFVGSANLDPRSGKLNTELGILLQSEPLAGGLADQFEENQTHIAYRVTLDRTQCDNEQRCEGRLRWTEEQAGRQAVCFKDSKTDVLSRFFVYLVSLLPNKGQE